MIQEAYCSFEVAKLLKEKGFNEHSAASYDLEGKLLEGSAYWNKTPVWYASPTHQMAMKWLREVHHIAINIGWGEIFEDQYKWWCIILNMDNGSILCEEIYCASYEEAVETALKYVLENLL